MEKFVIVDGNSLINRAFYALPNLTTLDGRPCGGVFGFVNMILNVILNEKPKYFVCVFDAGKHTFRHDMYADYKGTRDKTPEDLITQLKMLKETLHSMGIFTIEIPNIEADDIIGSFTRKFNEEFILLSGDKDLLQLINDNTTVWLTQKGISNVLKVDEEVLKQEFGIAPYQVIEMKSIMGDSSDNIPGVKGIGKIGAQKLIDEYKDLDNIYAHIDEIKGSTQTKLIENKEMAYLSKKLATIKLDVDMDVDLEKCEMKLPLGEEAYKNMENLGFKSMLDRKDLFHNFKPTIEAKDFTIVVPIIELESRENLKELVEKINSSFAVTIDDLSLKIAYEQQEYVVYTSGDLFNQNLDLVRDLFNKDVEVLCFDAKEIMHELDRYNIKIKRYFDVSIAIYIANELDGEISLDDALKLNNITTDNKSFSLFKLKENYINKLINNFQLKLFSDIELPLVKVLFDMEKMGIKIDTLQIEKLSASYLEEIEELKTKIFELAGEEFNVNSPKVLQSILFEKLSIPFKGKAGTSIEVLNAIRDKHEIVDYIIRYRKIAKLRSTYLDGMLNFVKEDGKIHTKFMQRSTSTGRLSSREPNLQNLPIRDDEGRALRKLFSSSFENGTLISADYSQIELRLIANFSDDENMVADFLTGKDIHSATASKIFNVELDEVTSSMRRVAKSVNFGIIYGISAFGLSQNIGCSPKEAGDFIKRYNEIYPKVKSYSDQNIVKARESGLITTMMGRTRHIPNINSSNFNMRSFAERVAMNMPLQGSASDIIKIAMIKVHERMNNKNLKSKLIIQIHDELVVDCYPGESETVKQILKEEMEGVVDLKVPLIVNIEEGRTLYDAK